MQRTLLEALAGSIASQASHSIPSVSGPVSSLALHYGLDWAGDESYKRLKKHKNAKRIYDKVFRSKNPKERPGKFASDAAALGGTAAGVHAAEKLVKGSSRKAILAKLALGVAGHTVGRFVGNAAGNKVNKVFFRKRKQNR